MGYEKQEKHHNIQNVKKIKNMPKSEIHPTWYPDAKVLCDGKVLFTTGSTVPEINIDVWSGNHPFYTGSQTIIDSEGRVDRFMKKYGLESENE